MDKVMKRLNLGIIFGGKSGEHEVSLRSAASVIRNIDKDRYNIVGIGIAKNGDWFVQENIEFDDNASGESLKILKNDNWFPYISGECGNLTIRSNNLNKTVIIDVVFPAVHGTFCEDGTLQAILELSGVPYVGADLYGSSIGMDKDFSKIIVRDAGIKVVPWETVKKSNWETEDRKNIVTGIIGKLGLPLFIKPNRSGSSVGVSKAKDLCELIEGLNTAFQYDTTVLVEESIDALELECAVLGGDEPDISAPGEINPNHEFYSYEAKYEDAEGAELVIPARLSDKKADECMKMASLVFKKLKCYGMARVDFFLDKKSDELYFNEINTLPGFTSISMFPKLWEYMGVPYNKIIDRLIELAIERSEVKAKLRTE